MDGSMKKKEEDIDAEGIARCIVWTNRVGAVVKELKEHGISATDNTELIRFIIEKAFPGEEELLPGSSAIGFIGETSDLFEEDVISGRTK